MISFLEVSVSVQVAGRGKTGLYRSLPPEKDGLAVRGAITSTFRKFDHSVLNLIASALKSVMTRYPPDQHVCMYRPFAINDMINHSNQTRIIGFIIELLRRRPEHLTRKISIFILISAKSIIILQG